MSMVSALTKLAVAGSVVTFSYGSIEDVVTGIMDGVSVNAAHSEMKTLHGKLMEFYTFNSRYPNNQQELSRFMEGEFDDPLEVVMNDPWSKPYIFFPDRQVEILCTGPDKKPKSRDDLTIDYPKNTRPPI